MHYWKSVLTWFYFFVGHFDLVGLKGRSSKKEGIANDSHRPDVDFVGVADWPLYDLGGDVVGSAAHGPLFLVGELELGSKAKVTNLDVHGAVEEDVAELKISVDDPVWVHILHSRDQLKHEEAGFLCCQSFSFFDHLAQGLRGLESTLLTHSSRIMYTKLASSNTLSNSTMNWWCKVLCIFISESNCMRRGVPSASPCFSGGRPCRSLWSHRPSWSPGWPLNSISQSHLSRLSCTFAQQLPPLVLFIADLAVDLHDLVLNDLLEFFFLGLHFNLF